MTRDEFMKAVVKLSDEDEDPPTEHDLAECFKLADVDRSGGIDYNKFVSLYAKVCA